MDNTMENTQREADAYSDYVQQQMGETLSEALVEIVQKRPADPIEYLADKLYKLGNRRPPSRANSEKRRNNMVKWNPPWRPPNFRHQTEITVSSTNTKGTMRTAHSKNQSSHTKTSKGLIKSDDSQDDFIDEDIHENGSYGTFVHSITLKIFNSIADIFDDDDIT